MEEKGSLDSIFYSAQPILMGALGTVLANIVNVDYVIPQKESWSTLGASIIAGTIIAPTLIGMYFGVRRIYKNSKEA